MEVNNNFKQRIISGFIVGAVAVLAGLLGGRILGTVVFVCALIGYDELLSATGVRRPGERVAVPEILGLIMTAAYYIALVYLQAGEHVTVFLVVLLFLLMCCVYVIWFPAYRGTQIMAAFFSFFYVPVLMSYVVRARNLPYGRYIFALILLCSWVCDTCAYFAGRFLGRHKLAPVLSPKKTVEGAIGGILGSMAACFIAGLVLQHFHSEERMTGVFLIMGFVCSVLSMIGDLTASAIKRNHNIKDFGHVIPGHGGIMDRFDSMLFVAPVIYYLGAWLL